MNDSIRELMDSCRPDRDDLRQPEMQPLADLIAADANAARQLDRSWQVDAVIGSAVREVPIPAGLQQRLLAALEEARADASSPPPTLLGEAVAEAVAADSDFESESASAADPLSPRGRSSFRSWRLWAAVATCAAVLALIPLLFSPPSAGEVGYEELVASALSWEPSAGGWTADNMIWTNHPLPNQMPAVRLDGRQQFELPGHEITASCYRVALLGGSARVFVFDRPPGFSLPTAPPDMPMSTQGRCVAAWTSGGLAYVVVLDGGVKDYLHSIRRTSQVTSWFPWGVTLCPTRTA